MARSGFILVVAALGLWACSSRDEPRAEAPVPGAGTGAATGAARPEKPARPDEPDERDDLLDDDDDHGKASGCLVDQGGCRPPPTAVPPCSLDADALRARTVPLRAVLDNPRAHADKTIAIEGPLIKNGAGCTEKACELTCCNTCTSLITIGDIGADEYVRLETATTPGLYLCRGDESIVCCQIEARGQTVIAQGTFQIAPGAAPPVYQLWVTELCARAD
jgi:hypothetical protein